MRMGRDEAFDLFRKWEAERALLVCNLGFSVFAVAFRARISQLSDIEIRLLSDDKHSKFAVKFNADMEFRYEDSRRTPDESELYECGVLITFSHDTLKTADQRDHIGFTEVKE